jgi:hypothetical protein
MTPAVVVKAYDAGIEKGKGARDRTLTFTISTADVDRDNDTVNVAGWDLDNFNKAGSVLWAHNPDLPPVAKPVKTWRARGEGSYVLKSTAQFTPPDMPHPFGEGFGHSIYRMYNEGYMRAVSVGFLPREWDMNEERNVTGRAGTDFKRQELLEFSTVPVPSNPQALVEVHGKGINIVPIGNWAAAALDLGQPVPNVSRKDIEAVYRIARGNPVSVSVPGNMQFEFTSETKEPNMSVEDAIESAKDELIERTLEEISESKEEEIIEEEPVEEPPEETAPKLSPGEVLEVAYDSWTRDEWAELLVGLADFAFEKKFELTATETGKLASFGPIAGIISAVKQKTVCVKPEKQSEPRAADVVIEDVEEFRKNILEAVHNEFVLPVTGKLF